MKKGIVLILISVLLVGVIIGGSIIYNNYTEENGAGNLIIIGGDKEKESKINSEETSELISENVPESESETESEPDDSVPQSEAKSETESKTESETESKTESETESPYLAPDFTVYDYEGNAVKLSDYRGKPIVLNFWSRGCKYCMEEMPDFQAAYDKYKDEVVFLMVCHVGFANVGVEYEQEIIDEKGYTFPVYYDTNRDAINKYGIRSLPITYFINRDFDLYTYIPGMASAEYLNKGIEMILE